MKIKYNILRRIEFFMSYTISKYDAIKALLKVEKQKHELANELMMAIRRAARYEITTNNYKTFYIINEEEKKLFEEVHVKILMLSGVND